MTQEELIAAVQSAYDSVLVNYRGLISAHRIYSRALTAAADAGLKVSPGRIIRELEELPPLTIKSEVVRLRKEAPVEDRGEGIANEERS